MTVTSTDGSRKRVYRVSVASSAEASCLRGSIHVGVSLVSYEGGSVRDLASCAARLHVKALHATQGGFWASYIVGAPDFVNRAFIELYPDGVPINAPLLATSDGPPAPDTSADKDLDGDKGPDSGKGSTQP
ncbi:MAG: hypothetical protein F4Y98_09300 [Chloroflexi bacterium]|nr:hypothetical protein [Chloroflexota bacterium]